MIFEDIDRVGFFDHARLLDDLRDTSKLFRDLQSKGLRPPLSFLQRLGKDMLNALPEDRGAWKIRWKPGETSFLRAVQFDSAFAGCVRFSWLIAAVILARDDLYDRFRDTDGFSFEAGLQWFVLHGVVEHRLWHLITPEFLHELNSPYLGTAPSLTPLQAIVLRERPDVASRLTAGSSDFEDAFAAWLRNEGIRFYNLFWVAPASQIDSFWNMHGSTSSRTTWLTRHINGKFQHLLSYRRRSIRLINGRRQDELLQDKGGPLSRRNSGAYQSPNTVLSFVQGEGNEGLIVAGSVGPATPNGVPLASDFVAIQLPGLREHSRAVAVEFSSNSGEFGSDRGRGGHSRHISTAAELGAYAFQGGLAKYSCWRRPPFQIPQSVTVVCLNYSGSESGSAEPAFPSHGVRSLERGAFRGDRSRAECGFRSVAF